MERFPQLPSLSTPLHGRATQVETVRGYLKRGDARLVTLTGPGGIGKTRLALEIASHLGDTFLDGVCFVDLAPLTDPRAVAPTVAGHLGIRDAGEQPARHALITAIADRRILLVLDNFEQVLAAADDLAALLEACPGLALLVTSRSPLRLAGECEVAVPPLPLPPTPFRGTEDALLDFPAAALFVERAQAARIDFRLTATNATAVAQVCTRLDGIPLAIELAAARIKVLSAEQIAARLDDCFRLLTSGPSSAPHRHRTLRAALDWSYDLLDSSQRALLRRISVFAGGCSLEAAEAVARPGLDLLDTLSELVDHALVQVTEDGGEARYRLLETVRQYGLERLSEADGEAATVRERHARWYQAVAERAEPELRGPDQVSRLGELGREHDNLRGALRWAIDHQLSDVALRLTSALWKFWEVRGHVGEGRRWLESALALDPSSAPAGPRAAALNAAGIFASIAGDWPAAIARHEAAIELRRATGDQLGVAQSLLSLGNVLRNRGDTVAAVALLDDSLSLFRRLGERRYAAMALATIGLARADRREYRLARPALEESLALFREVDGVRGVAVALGNLAEVARAEGDLVAARSMLLESLRLFQQVQDPFGCGVWLESLALVAWTSGDLAPAAVEFGAAEALRTIAGVDLPPIDRPEHARAIEDLRSRLGNHAFAAALARGRALSLDEAVAYAHAPLGPARDRITLVAPTPAASPLTVREHEVAALVGRGYTNKQIAAALVITKQTADKHMANILSKLGVTSRSQVAVWVVSRSALTAGAGIAA